MLRVTPQTMKFQALADCVGKAAAIGHLELLWHLTASSAPRGDIGIFSDDRIERGLDWHGEPSKLLESLIEFGWIDRVASPARLYVHNWHRHADRTVNATLARRGEWFANGAQPNPNKLPKNLRLDAQQYYASRTLEAVAGPSEDRLKTVSRQSEDSPERVLMPFLVPLDRPETVSRQSEHSPETVLRHSQDRLKTRLKGKGKGQVKEEKNTGAGGSAKSKKDADAELIQQFKDSGIAFEELSLKQQRRLRTDASVLSRGIYGTELVLYAESLGHPWPELTDRALHQMTEFVLQMRMRPDVLAVAQRGALKYWSDQGFDDAQIGAHFNPYTVYGDNVEKYHGHGMTADGSLGRPDGEYTHAQLAHFGQLASRPKGQL